ncbi:MAG: histidine phosphatase family protein [Gemmatimonadales bacterium]
MNSIPRRIFLALFPLVPLVLASRAAAQPAPTVVIVVRHAEKAAAPANDPPLTAAGAARAKALAAVLADANVQAIISTPLVRTLETARPTAEAHALAVQTVPVGGPVADHARAVAAAVRKHPGTTVLVVGHSNTVAAIIAALGGPKMPDLCDSQYSNLFTLVLDGASARLVRASYGAPSPDPDASCLNAMK